MVMPLQIKACPCRCQLTNWVRSLSSSLAKQDILNPLEKTVIAFDPDIPLAQQVLVFESEEALPKSYFWKLDDINRKSGFVKLADLKSGHYTLKISDFGEHAAHQVQFEVRGLSKESGPNHSAL